MGKTKNKESDPFYQLMDAEKEMDAQAFEAKYTLHGQVIQKHKADYAKYENAETEINLMNEWKSLLPLFENNTQSITAAMQSLSAIIHENDMQNNKRPNKKRKLNQNGASADIYTKKKKKKKRKRKRAWEIDTDEENEDNDANGGNDEK